MCFVKYLSVEKSYLDNSLFISFNQLNLMAFDFKVIQE